MIRGQVRLLVRSRQKLMIEVAGPTRQIELVDGGLEITNQFVSS